MMLHRKHSAAPASSASAMMKKKPSRKLVRKSSLVNEHANPRLPRVRRRNLHLELLLQARPAVRPKRKHRARSRLKSARVTRRVNPKVLTHTLTPKHASLKVSRVESSRHDAADEGDAALE